MALNQETNNQNSRIGINIANLRQSTGDAGQLPGSQNLIPPKPKSRKTFFSWLFALVLVVALALIGYIIYSNNQLLVKPAKPVSVVPSVPAKPVPTNISPAQAQAALLQAGELTIPPATTKGNITLPDSLSFLVPSEAQNPVVKTASFSGGKTGFEINYLLAKALQSIFKMFFNPPQSWTAETRSFAGSASLTVLNSSSYNATIQMLATAASTTSVTIDVVKQ